MAMRLERSQVERRSRLRSTLYQELKLLPVVFVTLARSDSKIEVQKKIMFALNDHYQKA